MMILRTGVEIDPSVAIPPYATPANHKELARERHSTGLTSIDPLQDPRWGDLVAKHPKASVFHSVEWLRALRSAYGYQPTAICTSNYRGRLTGGLVFCRIKSWLTGTRLVSLPFSDHCEPLTQTNEELQVIVQQLKRLVAQENWSYFEVRPTSSSTLENVGFQAASSYLLHA